MDRFTWLEKRRKHGGGRQRLDIESVDPPDWHENNDSVLAVDEALQQLTREEASVAESAILKGLLPAGRSAGTGKQDSCDGIS